MLKVAGHWFERHRVDDDITLIWEPHVVPLLRCNIWHVRGDDRDLVIDTGMGIASLRSFARDILDKPLSAVATHAHLDHIGGHHEFDEVLAHPAEADGLRSPTRATSLAGPEFDPRDLGTLFAPAVDGYSFEGHMLTALPSAGYDVLSYVIRPAKLVRTIDEGDVLDLGRRRFEVLHLPDHSPGGIGLWEAASGTLFSGDAIYDGPLVAGLHHSHIATYIQTMQRLRDLPVRIVHAGHDPSFGRDRLIEIANDYLARWGA